MLLLTCPYGLSKVLNNEIKKLGYSSTESFDTGLYIDGDLTDTYTLNIRSRIANKVFLRLNTPSPCLDFDQLYDSIHKISRAEYIAPGHEVSVKVHLRNSHINSIPSAQSIIHKAVLTNLTGNKETKRDIDPDKSLQSVYIIINENICSVYINTSGPSLHQRGYRDDTGIAPLKENLAAALVQLAGWNFKKPLIDPFCGSGTICIEAAMIARNIAPGLKRHFACEDFPCYDKETFEKIRETAVSKKFDGTYTIVGSDIDTEVLLTAKQNAKNAGVLDTIRFKQGDINDHIQRDINLNTPDLTIITNPPYGRRLGSEDLADISSLHHTLAMTQNINTILITGYEGASNIFIPSARKSKNTKNGAHEIKIYIRK